MESPRQGHIERAAAAKREEYKPGNMINECVKGGAITGLAGLAYASVQTALTKENIGARGVFTKYGKNVVTFAAMGASYELVKVASANLRERNDYINPTLGGIVAGAIVGTRGGTMASVVGYSAMFGVILGFYDYTGGRLKGFQKDATEDDDARAEELRRARRRPIEETIAELGEIRGIKAPGFAERRRERLKEKYGIEVTNDE